MLFLSISVISLIWISLQLLVLELGVLSKLLLKAASLAEAYLDAGSAILRISVHVEVDCDEGEVDTVEPDIVHLEAEKVNAQVHSEGQVGSQELEVDEEGHHIAIRVYSATIDFFGFLIGHAWVELIWLGELHGRVSIVETSQAHKVLDR
jgi:hypothetical protein